MTSGVQTEAWGNIVASPRDYMASAEVTLLLLFSTLALRQDYIVPYV